MRIYQHFIILEITIHFIKDPGKLFKVNNFKAGLEVLEIIVQ